MSGFPYQKEIDIYYENKKQEVGKWLLEFSKQQKRLTQTQRNQIQTYAQNVSFNMIGEIEEYIQNLKTIGKKNKEKLDDYISHIEWFPEGVNVGVLDGKIVSRILPNELDILLQENSNGSKK